MNVLLPLDYRFLLKFNLSNEMDYFTPITFRLMEFYGYCTEIFY